MIGSLVEYRIMYRKVSTLGLSLEPIEPSVTFGIILSSCLIDKNKNKYKVLCSDGSIKFSHLDEFKILEYLNKFINKKISVYK